MTMSTLPVLVIVTRNGTEAPWPGAVSSSLKEPSPLASLTLTTVWPSWPACTQVTPTSTELLAVPADEFTVAVLVTFGHEAVDVVTVIVTVAVSSGCSVPMLQVTLLPLTEQLPLVEDGLPT